MPVLDVPVETFEFHKVDGTGAVRVEDVYEGSARWPEVGAKGGTGLGKETGKGKELASGDVGSSSKG